MREGERGRMERECGRESVFPVMTRDDETELSLCVDKSRHLSEETLTRLGRGRRLLIIHAAYK